MQHTAHLPAPLRLAVIGAGLASAPHFRSLEDLAGQIEVVWVYGRSAERLASVQAPMGVRKTTRLDDILEDASVQAVLVLTPANTHLDIVQRAARAGKHVLVEKPLEIDLNRANALVEACEAAGVTLAVMLQHRLREAALGLTALLRTGELGPLVSAAASVRWWRPQRYYDEPGRGSLARDGGGVLITQAIHTLDLLLSYTGLPERVTGLARTSPVHRMEGEDSAAARSLAAAQRQRFARSKHHLRLTGLQRCRALGEVELDALGESGVGGRGGLNGIRFGAVKVFRRHQLARGFIQKFFAAAGQQSHGQNKSQGSFGSKKGHLFGALRLVGICRGLGQVGGLKSPG